MQNLGPALGRQARPIILDHHQKPPIRRWLPGFASDQRSYVTVAIGCTGGQHRSVYVVEQLARRFESAETVLTRHRALAVRQNASQTA